MTKKKNETTLSPFEVDDDSTQKSEALTPLGAVRGIVTRPLVTFQQMRESGQGHWWVVFALILPAMLISVIASVPVNAELQQRTFESQTEGLSGEAQAQVEQVQAVMSSQALLGGISFVTQIVGLAIGVALRAAVIFGLGTALGARASFKTTWNMAVWTTLPNAARLLVMAIAIIATGNMPSAGLSAILSGTEYRGASQVLLGLLSGIDIYLVWSLFLMWVGVQATAQLSRMKSGIVTAGYWAVTMICTLGLAAIGDALTGAFVGGTGPG